MKHLVLCGIAAFALSGCLAPGATTTGSVAGDQAAAAVTNQVAANAMARGIGGRAGIFGGAILGQAAANNAASAQWTARFNGMSCAALNAEIDALNRGIGDPFGSNRAYADTAKAVAAQRGC